MEIHEWAQHYLRHQDLIKKEIENIEEEHLEGCVLLKVTKKNGLEEWYVAGDLDAAAQHLDNEKRLGFICLNTKENVKKLVAHWKEFSQHPTLKVVFCNTKTNERWVIVPNHHARVADDKSLKLGLETMHTSITTA